MSESPFFVRTDVDVDQSSSAILSSNVAVDADVDDDPFRIELMEMLGLESDAEEESKL